MIYHFQQKRMIPAGAGITGGQEQELLELAHHTGEHLSAAGGLGQLQA